MKKIFILLSLGLFSLYAADLDWADSYKEAVAKAGEQNKSVMLLVTTETCRWCRKLESTTLKDEKVVTRLQRDYISVHVTRDVDDYPCHLKVKGVPTTFFLDVSGKPLIKKVIGYWNAEDYLSFLDDVDYKLGKKEY
ncbi:thioredoxin family protein [Campylobacterota bacterium]